MSKEAMQVFAGIILVIAGMVGVHFDVAFSIVVLFVGIMAVVQ